MCVNIGESLEVALTKVRAAAVIDLDAISKNIALAKNTVGSSTKLLAVIKADAYGHGAIPIARFTQNSVDYFGIATVEEGVKLREHGITVPILLLGITSENCIPTILDYDLMPTVSSVNYAKALSRQAILAMKVVKIHIALDTGMSRIGFNPTTQMHEIVKISRLPLIKLEGIFSHFSCADSESHTYTDMQYEKFIKCLALLNAHGVNIPTCHIANSAAIINYTNCHCDMARIGIMLYGLYPSATINHAFGLATVMSLVSHIAFINTVPSGTPVGYGGISITQRTTKIGVVPVGYADGLPRAYSANGCVIIKGQCAKILGRICMNQFMVDLTDLLDVAENDKVIIIGSLGGKAITIEEIAESCGSFNYELATKISPCIPRLYCRNGIVEDYLIQ